MYNTQRNGYSEILSLDARGWVAFLQILAPADTYITSWKT